MKRITLLLILSLFINGAFGDKVSVMEGDSVTLHTDTVIQALNDVTIIWAFGAQKTKIAQINTIDNNANEVLIYDNVPDGRFRGRLQLNDQTGDLTITNIRTTDSELYIVDIHVGLKETQKSFDVKGEINPESDQLKSVSVKDGDSVTLHTDVPDINKYDEIQWRFQGSRIAQFNKSASKISEDERFRDNLRLDVQTGSLQIKNIKTDLSGLYEVEISSTNSSYTIHQSFTVTVSGEVKTVSVMKGDPVTINTDVPDIKTYDRILLIFGCDDKRIADVNKQNKQFTLDKRFRERLTLNDQTGDLTITNIRYEDGGHYELKMSSRRRTIQRRFSVNVSERGLSPGAIAGITIFLLLLAAAAVAGGVIYYRRKIAEAMKQLVETLEVNEGESVNLKTEVKDIKTVFLIEWTSEDEETLIAKMNPANNISRTFDGDDDLFKDKLKLNDQTGDLTINDITWKHRGDYTLKIFRGGETSYKRFRVNVRRETKTLEVDEGKSADLKTEVKDINRDDVIEWTFGKTLIAKINPANNISSTYDGDDDLFRDKLKLNHQTGDLTINDISEKHTGVYKLKIIRDGKTSYKRFTVFVRFETEILEVDERKSVNLKTKVTDIKRDDVMEWRFRETLIAKINPADNIFNTYDGDDGLFRDKLKLNHQTGDLNISDIRWKHNGVYELKIIRDGKTSYKRFAVSVKFTQLLVNEGESVDLKTEVTDIKRDDVIEWRFKETLIAEINPANKSPITYDNDLFRDKLKLNDQTGDLTINDIRQKHTGFYKLKIIRDGETSDRRFYVSFRAGGDSVGIEMPLLNNSSQ